MDDGEWRESAGMMKDLQKAFLGNVIILCILVAFPLVGPAKQDKA